MTKQPDDCYFDSRQNKMIQKAPTETGCGDFNDNNTLKFISLNVWSPVGKTVWEGSQEGMRLGTDSEVSKV